MGETKIVKDIVGAIIIRDGKILAAKHGEGHHAYTVHKYEFPGGKQEEKESYPQTLIRECKDKLGVDVTIELPFKTIRHEYPDSILYLHTYTVRMMGEPVDNAYESLSWFDIKTLDLAAAKKEWAPADFLVLQKVVLCYGDLTETTAKSRTVFEGNLLTVHKDTVLLPNRAKAHREYITHKGAAGILVVDERENVYLCRQYRYAIGRETLEIPAGKRDSLEESFEDTARREVREEVGVIDSVLTSLGQVLPAVGYSNELIELFLAERPTFGEQNPDEDEYLNICVMPVRQAIKMCLDGEIKDSKTLVALLQYKALKRL